MQVLLAKHKADGIFYAVKVLQKKIILKKKEVGRRKSNVTLCCTEHGAGLQTHMYTQSFDIDIFQRTRGNIKNEVGV